MTRNELDRIFTNKVKEYFSKGFTINTKTMGGTQGELARVDVRKDDTLIRIYMETDGSDYGELINIIIGKAPQTNRNIWNSQLEIIEKNIFLYKTKNNYIPVEESDILNN